MSGSLHVMILGVLRQKQDYWSTEEDLFPTPAWYGMGLNRFEILMALSFIEQGHKDDKWHTARALLVRCPFKWNKVLTPGYIMMADESLFAWYGRGGALSSMSAVVETKRISKGVGSEVKTIADVATGIINLKISEGKEAMKEKDGSKSWAVTATAHHLSVS